MSDARTTGMSELAWEERLVRALRARKGRATVGDVVVDTGLPSGEVEVHLRRLLNHYESHLEVDEAGEVLYAFDPSLRRRDQGDMLARLVRDAGRLGWKLFVFLFKIAIMLTLVIYFVLFVVLVIAALVAALSGRGSSSSSSSSSSRRGGGIPIYWIGDIFMGSGRGRGRSRTRRYDDRGRLLEDRQEEEGSPPFYKKVFAYVFGPEANQEGADPFEEDRQALAFIRARRGVITAAELGAWAGWDRARAESEAARLLARHDGQVRVTRDGVLLYTFESVAVSAAAGGQVEPPGAGLEPAPLLTGNTAGANTFITFMNIFNIFGAMAAPGLLTVIDPTIQVGPLAWIGLSFFPLMFSLIFFMVPLGRWVVSLGRKRRLAASNVWRATLAELTRRASRGQAEVEPGELAAQVARDWPNRVQGREVAGTPTPQAVSVALDRAVASFEADVEVRDDGQRVYRFDGLAAELEAGRRARSLISPEQLRLGKIAFSSAADDEGLDLFDEALTGPQVGEVSASRLAQLDDDLGAFDEALEGQPVQDAQARQKLDDFEARLREAAEEAQEVEVSARTRGRG